MALRINRPQSSSIPESVFHAMEDLNEAHSELWVEGFRVNLLDSQANDNWKLTLQGPDGRKEHSILYADGHNGMAVCLDLLRLRDRWKSPK